MSQNEFQFDPPDRRSIWNSLALTMSQAAALTGVSERQIQHWMDKGYIQGASDGSRRVSGTSVDIILLVKQARAAGIPLRRAAAMAHDYLVREASAILESDMALWALQDLRERLAAARTGIEAVEGLFEGSIVTGGSKDGRTLPALAGDHVSSQEYD